MRGNEGPRTTGTALRYQQLDSASLDRSDRSRGQTAQPICLLAGNFI